MPESIHQVWTYYQQSQELTAWLTQIYAQGQGKTLLAYEFIWLLAVWTLTQWRLAHLRSWWTKMFNQLGIGVLFWMGALWWIPLAVWGEPYQNLLSFSLKALLKMLLA